MRANFFSSAAVAALLAAGCSEPHGREAQAQERLAGVLPDARIAVLERQGHGAPVGDPALLAAAVAGFVGDTAR